MLTGLQRAFVNAYNGPGSGRAAARAAGYSGTDRQLRKTASDVLKHPEVRAAITEKFGGVNVLPPLKPGRSAPRGLPRIMPPPGFAPSGFAYTAKTGTRDDRIALCMEWGRDETLPARDRIRALWLAAELAGEIGRGRYVQVPRVRVEQR